LKGRGRKIINAERFFVQKGIVRTGGSSGAIYVPARYVGKKYEVKIFFDDEPEEE
jgi:putative transposon-encoded protein